jgi:DeoR/GlpR family transcriptional regulator of sugar metabolism
MKKLTTEQINQIKELYSKGDVTQKKLSLLFNVTQQTINYYVNESENKKRREYFMIWYNKLPKEKKRAIYERKKEYVREYIKNRYKNDLEFREKIKQRSKAYKLSLK